MRINVNKDLTMNNDVDIKQKRNAVVHTDDVGTLRVGGGGGVYTLYV